MIKQQRQRIVGYFRRYDMLTITIHESSLLQTPATHILKKDEPIHKRNCRFDYLVNVPLLE